MKAISVTLAAISLAGSVVGCSVIPRLPPIKVPDLDIAIPTVDVGPMQEKREEVPPDDAESVEVDITFGAGELDLEAGSPENLFVGQFRYNVEQWEPKVAYDNGTLTVRQGPKEGSRNWGVPTDWVRNEWELELSPEVPMVLDLEAGAGGGDLDFTGLQLEALGLRLGAGDFVVWFNEPNGVEMSRLKVDAGASMLEIVGLGYASPAKTTVTGGVGDITLDLAGDWTRSADVSVTVGVGAITVRVPDHPGVRISTGRGLTNLETSGLRRSGDAYVNEAWGESDVELLLQISAGIGQVRLVTVSDE